MGESVDERDERDERIRRILVTHKHYINDRRTHYS